MELIEPKISVTSFDIGSSLKVVDQINKVALNFGNEHPIVVQIESYGGEVAGLGVIYNKLLSIPNPIITYCSGMALSAGCFLFTNIAKKPNRIISPTAKLMLHEVQSGAFGDVKDMVADVNFSKELSETWMNLTAKSIGMKDSTELKSFMRTKTESHNLFMNAEEAVKYGFADMIGNVNLSGPHVTYDVVVIPEEVKEEPKPVKPPKAIKRKKK